MTICNECGQPWQSNSDRNAYNILYGNYRITLRHLAASLESHVNQGKIGWNCFELAFAEAFGAYPDNLIEAVKHRLIHT